MNSETLVSVIVPLHNEERFLRKCLDSILSQTYDNLEVIVVDDNSTDSSRSVVKKVIEVDERVRLIRLKGAKGAQAARFAGVEEAKGERIMFVDSDDILRKKSVELLSDAMDEFEVDLVQMRFVRRVRGFNIRYGEIYDESIYNRKIDGLDFLNLRSYIGMDSYITPSLCGKLYRTSLMRMINRTPFDQFWGDDQICNIDYLRLTRSMAFIDYQGYIYRWGGRTTHFTYSDLEKYKNVYLLKLKLGQDRQYLNNEMLLLLRYYIRQLYTELGWTREAIIMVLKEELKKDLWKKIISAEEVEKIVDEEFAGLQHKPLKVIFKRLLK